MDPGTSPRHIVWARGRITTESCPVSFVTAESQTLLEVFHAWKVIGGADYNDLPARTVEAFFILENELRTEIRNGQ